MSFVALVLVLPPSTVAVASVGWGVLLLGALTFGVARVRNASPGREMLKHIVVALIVVARIVVAASRILGEWITAHVR